MAVLFFYPLIGIFLRSLDTEGDLSYLAPTIDFQNYVELAQEVAFRKILFLTFEISVISTLLCVVLGYPVAYLLTTLTARWSRLLRFAVLITFWTAILVRLYAWTVILGRRGIINTMLANLGLTDQPLDLVFNTTAVIIGMTNFLLPYMILILYSGMVAIERELLVAAYSLGASRWQAFSRVFLPLSLPALFAGALLVFILALGYFITPAVLGGAGDVTIAVYIEKRVQIFDWGASSAMGVVLLATTVGVFVIVSRIFNIERLFSAGRA